LSSIDIFKSPFVICNKHNTDGNGAIENYGGEGGVGDGEENCYTEKSKTFSNRAKGYGTPIRKSVNQLDLRTGQKKFIPL
jgi:hypothetical protein